MGCKRISVAGLRIESSGGDGIYFGQGGTGRSSEDIVIRDCVCHDNYRQGISLVDIKNLLHLVETIRDSEGDYLTIEFHGLYETMVLPRQEMFDSTEQILEDEGIRTPYSDDLRETWENRKK